MAKPLTAPARLALILPWLLGDPLSHVEIRRRIASFIAESRLAGPDLIWLHVPPRQWRNRRARVAGNPWQPERLERLRSRLLALLTEAVPPAPPRRARDTMRALPSLRLTIARTRAPRPAGTLSTDERRTYLGPHAYRMVVDGELDDVVTYCVMRTLTEPGAVALVRCPAPAPGNWSERCGRFLVAGGRGRPREYCSLACRVRHHSEEVHKTETDTLRRPRRATRRK